MDMDTLWRERNGIIPKNGLPLDLFEWLSTYTPIPNVDLLILNDKGEILLSWRDDVYYGKGWHIPGGCIRFKETIEERIKATAINEVGIELEHTKEPIATREMIMCIDDESVMRRAHHIALLYECKVPENFQINNGDKRENDAGFLKWFKEIPQDILEVHSIYDDIFFEHGFVRKRDEEKVQN